MIKLSNPYSRHPDYNCFGCSQKNPIGLRMQFFEDGDEIVSTWEPEKDYAGYHDVLHGGIQATMMDEIASWVVFMKLDTAGVTYQLNTRYRKPVMIPAGPISLRASLVKVERRMAEIQVKLFDGKGQLCSESTAGYFVLPLEKARSEFDFPGKEAFYETE